MTVTLEAVEILLLKRAGGRMEYAEMEHVLRPNNPDLVEPILFALLCMDVTPASFTAVTDTDLLGVADTDLLKLLDLAELRLLENIVGNLALADVTVGPRRENLSQIVEQTEKAITRLRSKAEKLYGLGAGVLEAGTISLDFMSKHDDTVV